LDSAGGNKWLGKPEGKNGVERKKKRVEAGTEGEWRERKELNDLPHTNCGGGGVPLPQEKKRNQVKGRNGQQQTEKEFLEGVGTWRGGSPSHKGVLASQVVWHSGGNGGGENIAVPKGK